jgi:hypothetical protein
MQKVTMFFGKYSTKTLAFNWMNIYVAALLTRKKSFNAGGREGYKR